MFSESSIATAEIFPREPLKITFTTRDELSNETGTDTKIVNSLAELEEILIMCVEPPKIMGLTGNWEYSVEAAREMFTKNKPEGQNGK